MGGLNQRVTTAGWEGRVLVMETIQSNGLRTIERLRLLTRPRRLEMVTELPIKDEKGKTVQVKQIFLPAPAQSSHDLSFIQVER